MQQKKPCLTALRNNRCTLEPTNALRWRHSKLDDVSNHRRLDCLLSSLFRRRSKKISKLRVTGLCKGISPVTGEFPAQRASNAEFFFHLMTSSCAIISDTPPRMTSLRDNRTAELRAAPALLTLIAPFVLILLIICWDLRDCFQTFVPKMHSIDTNLLDTRWSGIAHIWSTTIFGNTIGRSIGIRKYDHRVA